jgi:hypothetical protein
VANELTASISLAFSKSGRVVNTENMGLLGKLIDVTGTDYNFTTQEIGLTPEALNLGDCATAGYVVLVNIETFNASNYVTVRNGSSGADVPLLFVGDFAIFRAAVGATLYCDATGAVQVLKKLILEP